MESVFNQCHKEEEECLFLLQYLSIIDKLYQRMFFSRVNIIHHHVPT